MTSIFHFQERIDHPDRKSNKEIFDLNYILVHIDTIEIYRIFHQTVPKYTYFSSTHRVFSRIDNIRSKNKL